MMTEQAARSASKMNEIYIGAIAGLPRRYLAKALQHGMLPRA